MLYFDFYRLSPFNCAVNGKFVSSLLAQFTGIIPLNLSTDHCKIGDYGLEQFLQPVFFTMHPLACTTTESKCSNKLSFFLGSNNLTHKSVGKLKHVLILQSNPLTLLLLSNNFNHSMTNKYIILKHFIECLAHKKCSLSSLKVDISGFTEQHIHVYINSSYYWCTATPFRCLPFVLTVSVLGLLFSAHV